MMRPGEHEQLRAVADSLPIKYHISSGIGKRIIKNCSSRIGPVMFVQNRLVALLGQHHEANHVIKGAVSTDAARI